MDELDEASVGGGLVGEQKRTLIFNFGFYEGPVKSTVHAGECGGVQTLPQNCRETGSTSTGLRRSGGGDEEEGERWEER